MSALVQVVLPDPVGPDTKMFLRLRTAKRMKDSYSCASKSRRSSVSVSSKVSLARRVARKIPLARNFSIDQTSSLGRRIVIATHPGLVAGGNTIWMRSPVGKEAERSGVSSSIRWRVEFATSFARRRHQSKSANGTSSCRQPSRVSKNAIPG